MRNDSSSGAGDWGQSFSLPVSCCPSSRTFSHLTAVRWFLLSKIFYPFFLTGSNLAFFVSRLFDNTLPCSVSIHMCTCACSVHTLCVCVFCMCVYVTVRVYILLQLDYICPSSVNESCKRFYVVVHNCHCNKQ